jgi:hypothetical protein
VPTSSINSDDSVIDEENVGSVWPRTAPGSRQTEAAARYARTARDVFTASQSGFDNARSAKDQRVLARFVLEARDDREHRVGGGKYVRGHPRQDRLRRRAPSNRMFR